jgi:hypothetical protein
VPVFATTPVVQAPSRDGSIRKSNDKRASILVIGIPWAVLEYPALASIPISGSLNVQAVIPDPGFQVKG